jgi:hypothetical protein
MVSPQLPNLTPPYSTTYRPRRPRLLSHAVDKPTSCPLPVARFGDYDHFKSESVSRTPIGGGNGSRPPRAPLAVPPYMGGGSVYDEGPVVASHETMQGEEALPWPRTAGGRRGGRAVFRGRGLGRAWEVGEVSWFARIPPSCPPATPPPHPPTCVHCTGVARELANYQQGRGGPPPPSNAYGSGSGAQTPTAVRGGQSQIWVSYWTKED